jgi:hypothetical protein
MVRIDSLTQKNNNQIKQKFHSTPYRHHFKTIAVNIIFTAIYKIISGETGNRTNTLHALSILGLSNCWIACPPTQPPKFFPHLA